MVGLGAQGRPDGEAPATGPRDGGRPHAGSLDGAPPLIGVLAIQGGFEAHGRVLRRLGAAVREVRTVADLDGLNGLVLPGGESTAITLGMRREGLEQPLRELAQRVPVLGSCAGLILLDRDHLGVMDIVASRNAFGRQIRSFEANLELKGIEGPPLRGVFIRAPWISEHGQGVEVLAEVDGHAVAAREGDAIAVSFHSELTDDDRVHRLLLEAVGRRRAGRAHEEARPR